MKRLLAAAVAALLIGYLAAFYGTGLRNDFGQPIRDDAGRSLSRFDQLWPLLLRPDDLLPIWFGAPPQFALADRLPVLLVAAAVVLWAWAAGRLALRAIVRGTGVPVRQPARTDIPARPPATTDVPASQEASTQASGHGCLPRQTGFTRLEVFVFSTGVGLNILSTWVLLLGLLGLLSRFWLFTLPATLTLLAAAVCACRRRVGRIANPSYHRGQMANLPRFWPFGKLSRIAASSRPPGAGGQPGCGEEPDVVGIRWLWAALPFVLVLVLASVLPPLDFDVCEYHLQAPKEFFEQGRIGFLPHNVYANMPMGAEMLSLLAMSIAGDWWWGALAGKLVTVVFTPLCALGLLAAGRRFYSTAAGVVAALLYLSVPWILSVSSQGLIDGVLACYLFLALYAVLLWKQGVGSGGCCLLLGGYLAGAAAATKYPGILFVLVPLAAWVLRGRRAGEGERERATPKSQISNLKSQISNLKSQISNYQIPIRRLLGRRPASSSPASRPLFALAVFLLAATAGCGLWFAKSWALTGNPTYPLLYGAFDGKTWNADKEARWNHVHRPHDFSLPTLVADAGRVILTSPGLSPLVVPLAVLAFLRRKEKWRKGEGEKGRRAILGQDPALAVSPSPPLPLSPSLALLAYALFVLAEWWLLTHRIDRFWIPVLPLLALLGGAGAVCCNARWWRRLLAGALAAGLAANFLAAAAQWDNAWFVPLAALRHDPRRVKPWHAFFNAHAADGGVLAVGDAAVFDLEPPVLYNTCFDDCVFQRLVEGRAADEVRAELVSRHIAYVYVDWDEIERYRSPGNYGFTDFVQPAVLDRLVQEHVLIPLQPIDGFAARAYRVRI